MNAKKMFTFVIVGVVLAACAGPQATPEPEQPVSTVVVTQEVLVTPTATSPAPLPDEIVIGDYAPMTGNCAGWGEMEWNAVQLANKNRPTVLGKPVRIVLADNKSDKTESALAVSRLIEVENVHGIIGTAGSSFSMAGAEVAEKAGIPVVSTSATNPLVTQGKPHVFRVAWKDPLQGKILARYAVEELGAKTCAIIQDVQQDYCVGLANFFREEFIALTGDPASVLGVVSFQTGDKDFTSQLTTAKAWNPDVVFAPNFYREMGLMFRQAVDLGLYPETPILGGDAWEAPELLELAGDAINGACYSVMYHPDAFTSEMAQEFANQFEQEYGLEPDQCAATGYDAYNLMLDAIEKAGSVDPEAITSALASIEAFVGLSGKMTIDEEGDALRTGVLLCIDDGEKVVQSLIEPPES